MSDLARERAERARLFVALELDRPAIDALVQWREAVVARDRGWRAVPPGNVHVTLCFLGMVAAAAVASLCDSVARAAGDLSVEGLSLGDPVLLPPRRPRVLAVRLTDAVGSLARLQAAVSQALVNGAWYAPEARPYLAHVTVARARERIPPRARELPPVPPVAVSARSVTVFRSRLGGAGARYEPLAQVPLGG